MADSLLRFSFVVPDAGCFQHGMKRVVPRAGGNGNVRGEVHHHVPGNRHHVVLAMVVSGKHPETGCSCPFVSAAPPSPLAVASPLIPSLHLSSAHPLPWFLLSHLNWSRFIREATMRFGVDIR